MISGRPFTGLYPDARMNEFHERRQSSNPGEAAGGAGTAGGRWQRDVHSSRKSRSRQLSRIIAASAAVVAGR